MWGLTYWISLSIVFFLGFAVVAPELLLGVLLGALYIPVRNLYRKAKDWQPPNFAEWWQTSWGRILKYLSAPLWPILAVVWLIAKSLHFALVGFLELSGSSPEKIEEEMETIDNFFGLGR